MTQTSIAPSHTAPLQPGEIRRHTVGAETFTAMHTGGGMYVQVCVHVTDAPTKVLFTGRSEVLALTAYAAAIETAEAAEAVRQAEAAAAQCLGLPFGPHQLIPACGVFAAHEPHAIGEGMRYRQLDVAPTALAKAEPVGPTLIELVEAYGAAMARAGIVLSSRSGGEAEARPYATEADRIKAEIVERFGGGA